VPRDLQIYARDDGQAAAPWQVAAQLRWLIVRDVLLDPISWLLLAISAWVLGRGAADLAVAGTWGSALVTITALCAATAFAVHTADRLLFSEADNELLRVQPLEDAGLYLVRQRELRWWLWPVSLLAAAAGLGAGGWLVAGLTLAGALGSGSLGLSLALLLRAHLPSQRGFALAALLAVPAACLYLLAGTALPWPGAGPWLAAAPGLIWGIAGRLAAPLSLRLFRSQYAPLASRAAVRDRSEPGRLWHALMAGLPLPVPLRARLARDLVLLARGWDRRGALLILLSPLSCLYLADVLGHSLREAALPWRVLESAALGAAAIAYAVGPNIHVLRNQAMSWSRTAPQPGSRALRGALLYGLLFALLHGGLVLATLATARDGRYLAEVAPLAFPVLALEAGMVHFAVVFTMAESLGRRVAGEGALILALACIGAGLAVVGYLYPLALPLYLLLTTGLAARAVHRYERLEVTW